MAAGNLQLYRAEQRTSGDVEVEHPGRLLLQDQYRSLVDGFDGLELRSAIR